MEDLTRADSDFKLEDCRAKHRVSHLVDCLTPAQARICRCSIPFGSAFFCKHPRRDEIIENTQNADNIVVKFRVESEDLSTPKSTA